MKSSYRKSWAVNLLMLSDLTPLSRSNDGSLALVSCLWRIQICIGCPMHRSSLSFTSVIDICPKL